MKNIGRILILVSICSTSFGYERNLQSEISAIARAAASHVKGDEEVSGVLSRSNGTYYRIQYTDGKGWCRQETAEIGITKSGKMVVNFVESNATTCNQE